MLQGTRSVLAVRVGGLGLATVACRWSHRMCGTLARWPWQDAAAAEWWVQQAQHDDDMSHGAAAALSVKQAASGTHSID